MIVASYLSYDHCGHGLCGSHLLRELIFIVGSNHYRWARNMKRLLLDTCRKVAESEEKCLSAKEYTNLQKRYSNILTRVAVKNCRKYRQSQKADGARWPNRMPIISGSVFKNMRQLFCCSRKTSMFLITNNRAERDLRMAKVKQKVSGCFRLKLYAEAYCKISSYLQTMANQGGNPLVAIQMALAGKIHEVE